MTDSYAMNADTAAVIRKVGSEGLAKVRFDRAGPGHCKYFSGAADVLTDRRSRGSDDLLYGIAGYGSRPYLSFHLQPVVFDRAEVFTQRGERRECDLGHQHTRHETAHYTLSVAAGRFHCRCVLIKIQGTAVQGDQTAARPRAGAVDAALPLGSNGWYLLARCGQLSHFPVCAAK